MTTELEPKLFSWIVRAELPNGASMDQPIDDILEAVMIYQDTVRNAAAHSDKVIKVYLIMFEVPDVPEDQLITTTGYAMAQYPEKD